jgi:hypothetical protein
MKSVQEVGIGRDEGTGQVEDCVLDAVYVRWAGAALPV